MDLKELKIVPPKGMEWYQEGNEIKFGPIEWEADENTVNLLKFYIK